MWWLPQNLGWKLGSLAIAIVLWVALAPREEAVAVHNAPVLYRNLNADMWLTEASQDSLMLELRGPARLLTAPNLADVVAVVDLAGMTRPSERTITLDASHLNLPTDVVLQRAMPAQLRVRVDHRQTKDVPVEPDMIGEVPAGYQLVSKSVVPEVVRLVGGEQRLRTMTRVRTGGIQLRDLTEPAEIEVRALVEDGMVQFETSPAVTVKLDIQPKRKK